MIKKERTSSGISKTHRISQRKSRNCIILIPVKIEAAPTISLSSLSRAILTNCSASYFSHLPKERLPSFRFAIAQQFCFDCMCKRNAEICSTIRSLKERRNQQTVFRFFWHCKYSRRFRQSRTPEQQLVIGDYHTGLVGSMLSEIEEI